MPALLIVDDDPDVAYSLEKSLRSESLDVYTAGTAAQGIDFVQRRRPDAVILDIRLPDMPGLEAFDRLRAIDPRLPVLLVTAFATTEMAIEAMKRGAFEYLLKPVDLHLLREMVAKALEISRLRQVPAVFDEVSPPGSVQVDRIIGRSPVMHEVYKAIGRIASLDVNVLILGGSGTGKELVARAIYHYSHRDRQPFLAINCAAIPEALLDSELFGHERGAFTGADRRRIGKFEQAHQGTLFLDEIGEMSLATQAKLLRLLQEQRFDRLGGNELVETNVRLLAATNQNLEAAVAAGTFRQDLYYRLKAYTISLPPLRDRTEDIPLLVAHFLAQFSRELGKQLREASPEFLQQLLTHDWPGNVRELQNVVRHAAIHARGETLTADLIPGDFASSTGSHPRSGSSFDLVQLVRDLLRSGQKDVYRRVSLEVDRVVLDLTLRQARGNQVLASELLGISRNTLRAKLRTLGLGIQKQLLSDPDTAGS
ncbi:MAG: sigma-54-dependent transcriptional regulator [Pirellulaceae bacterium]